MNSKPEPPSAEHSSFVNKFHFNLKRLCNWTPKGHAKASSTDSTAVVVVATDSNHGSTDSLSSSSINSNNNLSINGIDMSKSNPSLLSIDLTKQQPQPEALLVKYRRIISQMRYEHLVAGITGGVLSTLILHPLDLLKIRLAVNDGLVATRPQYLGLRHASKTILREEGLRGFYRGVTPNCVGAGVAWGLYFLFYNTIKTQILRADPREVLGPMDHIKAAAEAGVLVLIITNPLWVVKTRLCLQYSNTNDLFHLPPSKRYFSMMDTFRKVYKYEGFSGFYKGFVPGMFGVSHGAIQFMAYEEFKKHYVAHFKLDPKVKFNTAELLMFAIVSKICAATITYPSQVLRARLQDQHNVYQGFIDTLVKTWRLEGITGFYKGLLPNLLRVAPACGITFVVYENFIYIFNDYFRPSEAAKDR